MLVLDSEPRESGDAMYSQMQNAVHLERPVPSIFDDSLLAIPKGIISGRTAVMQLGAKLAEEAAQPADEVFGTHAQQSIKDFESFMDVKQKFLQPSPLTTGFVGNVLYGVSQVATEAGIGGSIAGTAGAITLPTVTQAHSTYREEEPKVGNKTALELASLAGGATAIGALGGGIFGKTIATKIASGIASNTALGGVNRYAASKILENAGYKDMADQYRVMDGSAIAADAILGAGFGLMHGQHPELEKNVMPGDIDVALAAKGAQQFEDSAPGIPTTARARTEHYQAMNTATQQLLKGDPVNVSNVFKGADYLERPIDPGMAKVSASAAKDIGLTEALDELASYRAKARELGIQIDERPFGQDMAIPPNEERVPESQNVIGNEPATKQVPEPQDIVQFLRQNGGLRDEEGELAHTLGVETATPFTKNGQGLIRKNGLTHDAAREKAQEAGYLPEGSDINDLRNAVADTLNGNRVFKPEETHLAGRKIDLEEEAFHTGVDTVGKTPEEIRMEIDERRAIAIENGVGEVLQEHPNMEIPTEYGDKNAYQAMSEADVAEKMAEQDSKLYEVAVNCAIRNIF